MNLVTLFGFFVFHEKTLIHMIYCFFRVYFLDFFHIVYFYIRDEIFCVLVDDVEREGVTVCCNVWFPQLSFHSRNARKWEYFRLLSVDIFIRKMSIFINDSKKGVPLSAVFCTLQLENRRKISVVCTAWLTNSWTLGNNRVKGKFWLSEN